MLTKLTVLVFRTQSVIIRTFAERTQPIILPNFELTIFCTSILTVGVIISKLTKITILISNYWEARTLAGGVSLVKVSTTLGEEIGVTLMAIIVGTLISITIFAISASLLSEIFIANRDLDFRASIIKHFENFLGD